MLFWLYGGPEVNFTTYEVLAIGTALFAVFMLGSISIRRNLVFLSLHTLLIAAETFWIGRLSGETRLYLVALIICFLKAAFIPGFLSWVRNKVEVQADSCIFLSAPACMLSGAALFGLSYLISIQVPGIHHSIDSRIGAASALSLLFSGMLLMLTRKIALSQIIGFLVIENGIYLVALTQTKGMPMIVELGIMLDVLVGVMITGLLLFRIKKNFEHIDTSQLSELHG